MRSKRIVITGGVLTPAVAVIEELKKRSLPAGRQGGWEIYYLGRKYSLEGSQTPAVESKVIPQTGAKFIAFAPGRLQRRFTRYTLPALLRVPLGFCQALFILAKIKPDVVCSFGGYVSVPVVVAGWFLRIPILTHEQTVVFGLASKINAFFADKVAVSFTESLKYFPKDKAVLTGNPIRKEIFETKKSPQFPIPNFSRKAGSRSAGQFPIIYVTGGNQGAKVINRAVLEILSQLLEKYTVIHQCGDLDYEDIQHTTYNIQHTFLNRYFPIAFIGPQDIGWVMNKAYLIISRAGANTVTEIAALGKSALFIPIPWSYQNEQTKNAQMLVAAGTAEILPQAELSGKTLLEKITQMISDLPKYQKNATKAKALVRLDATERLVKEIESLVTEK